MSFLFSEIDKNPFYFCAIFRELIVLMVLFQAGVSDIASGRIPNNLLLTGLIFSIPFLKPEDILVNALGGIIVFCFFIFIWRLGFMGGGDVKLISYLTLIKGIEDTLWIILISFIAVIILNSRRLILKERLCKRFRNLLDYIKKYEKGGENYVDIADRKSEGIPLAAYIYFSDLIMLLCLRFQI
ncbi:MAG: A24 family peptidase [Eubacteriales bacterium]|nr:A24 family peptidase [Eubacteriales bacterium]